MNTATQLGHIEEMIRETEAVKFKSYGVEQRLKALRAIRETLKAAINAPQHMNGKD